MTATEEEINYLVAAASSYFKRTLTVRDVVWSYSGVRPLYDNGATNAQETTRDYVLSLDRPGQDAPMLSVFGGKITTYRCLAEDALDKLAGVFPAWAKGKGWTAKGPLPGGNFACRHGRPARGAHRHGLSVSQRARGTPAGAPLRPGDVRHPGQAKSRADLGQAFGGFLTEAEVMFLVEREYARTAADIVWRRTKSGLRMRAEEIDTLDRFLQAHRAGQGARAAE